MKFVQLHTHTFFSLLDGIISPEEYVKKAKEFGMEALAITDHGSMSGLLRFSNACRKEGIKGIMGCEFYINNNRDNEDGKKTGTNNHIVLLAKNEAGYKNLLKINYNAMDKGFYYRGRTSEDFMFKHKKGVICLSACLAGPISTLIRNDKNKEALEKAKLYKKHYKEDFYIELHFNELEEQIKVNKILLKICEKLNIKYIVTGDCHYLNRGDEKIQDLTLMIARKNTISDLKKNKKDTDKNVFRFSVRCLWFHHPKDYLTFNTKFGYNFPKDIIMKAIQTTEEVGKKCNFMLEGGEAKFPRFINDDKMEVNAEKILDEKCWDAFQALKLNIKLRLEYRNRLIKELKVIRLKEFADYFLIIEDIIKFCKVEKIAVGAGRGSAAGSLVSYLLGITRVDPIKFDLLFERFLNKDRKDPPDIDLDFESDRKPEIEAYLKKKYGHDRVAHIVTFSTFRIKGALRDVFKVHEKEKDKQFNSIVNKMRDDQAKASSSILKQLEHGMSKDEQLYIAQNKSLFEISERLIGRIKNVAQHAGGTAITPGPMYDYIPVLKMKGEIVTGFIEGKDYRELSQLGVLKVDILGLETISVLDLIKKTVKEHENINIDYDKIDLEDEKLYHGINNYNSDGIFQFEGAPIYEFLKKVNPRCFEDIVTINAMYRPAIINAGELDKYLDRREKRIAEGYEPKDELDKILEVTYGTIAYQEQFMVILQKLGEFTLEEADKARKTFKMLYLSRDDTEAKKKDPELLKVTTQFQKGAQKTTDYSDERIEALMNKLSEFAEYAFNRCVIGSTLVCKAASNQFSPQEESIETLYDRMREDSYVGEKYRKNGYPKVLSLNYKEERIKPGKIADVFQNGVKKVYKLELEDGKSVICTETERFLKKNFKYERLSNIKVGEEIIVMGGYEKHTTSNGRGRPTELSKVRSIKYIGKEMTYDLEMEEYHNYIANGIVVHNSHSVSYAIVAMQALYAREYFPLYFYCALLNRNKNSVSTKGIRKVNKSKKYLYSARRRGIEFLQIDISRSFQGFLPEKTDDGDKVRVGLTFIPGLGINVANEIVENAPYGKVSTFCIKELKFEKSNKTAILNLIKIGAFDRLFQNRKILHDFFEEWSKYKSKYKESTTDEINDKLMIIMKGGEEERFGKNGRRIKSHSHDGHLRKKDWTDEEKEMIEKEVCNFNVFSQVESEDESIRKIHELKNNGRIVDLSGAAPEPDGDKQYYCFKIISHKQFVTKTKRPYAFLTVEDWNGIQREAVAFEPYWSKIEGLMEDRYYIANGYWQHYDGTGKIRFGFKGDDWGKKYVKINGKGVMKHNLFYFKQLLELKNI